MKRYIPYCKMSKKKRREADKKKRAGWGVLSPVTRKPPNSRAYNRKKAREREEGRRE